MIRCLIVDDEAPAREELRRVLMTIPDLEIAGEAANGLAALEQAADLSPDLVFLDIEMPGLKGMEVAAQLPAPARVIFVTAFDEYAVKAFDANAIDYVLKPFRADRIRLAVEKAQAVLDPRAGFRRLLHETQQPLTRLAVRKAKRIVLLEVKDITHASVEDKLAFVYSAGARHITDRTLTELEEMLDGFFRISRSELVNLNHIAELIPWFSGTYKVKLKSGEELDVSRERSRELRSLLGI